MELQWPLVIFTLLVCLGAGTLGVAALLAALKKAPETQFVAATVAIGSVVLGGVASFLHLQHFERAFNGFGDLTSGITQEMIGILVFLVVAVIYLVLVVKGTLPTWAAWLAVVVSVALVVVVANSYLMDARPIWNSPLLWLYYLSNATLSGSLVLAVVSASKKTDEPLITKIALGGAALTLVCLIAYAIYIPALASNFTSVGNYFDPTQPTKVMADPEGALSGFLFGGQALLFWGGAIVLGVVVPAVVIYLRGRNKTSTPATPSPGSVGGGVAVASASASLNLGLVSVAIVCVLLGAICFRVVLYALGFSVFVFY